MTDYKAIAQFLGEPWVHDEQWVYNLHTRVKVSDADLVLAVLEKLSERSYWHMSGGNESAVAIHFQQYAGVGHTPIEAISSLVTALQGE